MDKLLAFLAASVGGWVGWALGDHFSILAAVVLSGVGSGVGIYFARRLVQDYF